MRHTCRLIYAQHCYVYECRKQSAMKYRDYRKMKFAVKHMHAHYTHTCTCTKLSNPNMSLCNLVECKRSNTALCYCMHDLDLINCTFSSFFCFVFALYLSLNSLRIKNIQNVLPLSTKFRKSFCARR